MAGKFMQVAANRDYSKWWQAEGSWPAQFQKAKLNGALLHGRTAGTPVPANFGKYNSAVNEELKKNGKKNQQDRLFMGVPNSAMPMRCGYTITNPLNYQGTDVGYAGGGEGGTGGAA